MKITKKDYRCRFCNSHMDSKGRAWLANPFCADCLPQRLEASGAIDLRDNHKIIDHNNGYISIVPIDETKLWKAVSNDE
jgi:hypothetical protein